jgi:tryptophan synthase alpha chain
MSNNRIDQKFRELQTQKKKAFIAFLTAGDPDLKTTRELVLEFEKVGVDIVELGVPFSDPLADGPTIQAASQRALAKGVDLRQILAAVQDIRQVSQVPIALMTYYNPVYRYGEDRFIHEAKQRGVDGVIIPDLPPEEAGFFIRSAKEKDISTVFFLAPTTTDRRMKSIVEVSTGFVYYVSLTGVTGTDKGFSKDNAAKIRAAKKWTKTPVCVGFGVSTPEQVKALGKIADGVIVGSAIVQQIEKHRGAADLVQNVSRFVGTLAWNLQN